MTFGTRQAREDLNWIRKISKLVNECGGNLEFAARLDFRLIKYIDARSLSRTRSNSFLYMTIFSFPPENEVR